MKKPESRMRAVVLDALRTLHAVPVESGLTSPGIPDVNHAHGWIELKTADRWPARAATPLRLPHFTQEQRIWIARRARLSVATTGREGVHVLLLVGCEWLLFRGSVAATVLGFASRDELSRACEVHWLDGLDAKELITWVSR